MLINTHSHKKPSSSQEWVCRNAFHIFDKIQIESFKYPVSVGLHPWHSDRFNSKLAEKISAALEAKNVGAIGEAGLDKICNVSWNEQIAAWNFQFQLAQQKSLPIIIHCVKAHYDFVPFCKDSKVPMLFHGFQGNEEILKDLSRFETSYFSFGKSIFQNQKIQELILKVTPNRLLLETDTGPFSIEQVYEKAAFILGFDLASLQSLLKKNALEFFGKNAFHNFGENSIEK